MLITTDKTFSFPSALLASMAWLLSILVGLLA
jgi:hypothetical protein